jgi:dihydrofolate synthase / folylpolyglutamate synthase
MRAIAEAGGLRVHAFTKPHLFRLNERFVVANEIVADERLLAAADLIAAISPDITHFDALVAAAFLLFSETPADVVLLETGMGGRDDSTNLIERPALTIITPIGLDHQDALGFTLDEIAEHKAGILKRNAPAFIARQTTEAMAVIEAHAAHVGARLCRCGVEWDAYVSHGKLVVQTETRALDLPLPALAGAHQIENAGLACSALMSMHAFGDDAFARGIANANLPGRLQAPTRGPLKQRARDAELWVDGGHNAHAAAALRYALADMQKKRPARTALIVGMRARKDWRAFVEALAPSADLVFAVPLPDGADPGALARAAGARARTASDLPNAIDAAIAGGAGRVLICGSLSLAAMALAER